MTVVRVTPRSAGADVAVGTAASAATIVPTPATTIACSIGGPYDVAPCRSVAAELDELGYSAHCLTGTTFPHM